MSYLWRALIPSWRFFDQLETIPHLFLRLSIDGESFDAWQNCFRKTSPDENNRNWKTFFFNANGNLRLAEISLVERLLSEVQDLSADSSSLSKSVSYRLVEHLVRARALEVQGSTSPVFFQFRIQVESLKTSHSEEALVSLVHEV